MKAWLDLLAGARAENRSPLKTLAIRETALMVTSKASETDPSQTLTEEDQNHQSKRLVVQSESLRRKSGVSMSKREEHSDQSSAFAVNTDFADAMAMSSCGILEPKSRAIHFGYDSMCLKGARKWA